MAAARRQPTTSKLTAKLIEEICVHLRQGHPKKAAAAACGIHRATLHRWESRGRDARAKIAEGGHRVTAEERLYAQLADDLELAWDVGEWFLMQLALDIATGKRKGRATEPVMLLERTRSEDWRRRSSSEYVDKAKMPRARLDVSKLTPGERSELRELLQKAKADGA